MHRFLATVIPFVIAAAPSTALSQLHPDTSLVVSTEWLAHHLDDPSVVVLVVEHDGAVYAKAHIKGARFLDYMALARDMGAVHFEMLDADSLSHLLANVGVSAGSHVIIDAPMFPMATRAAVTLQYAGVKQVSLLNGGTARWVAEHRPMSSGTPTPQHTEFTATLHPELIATADWVRDHMNQPGVSIIDTRTGPEYNGTGERHGDASRGHVPGARQLEWETLTSASNEMQLKDIPDLQRLYQQRVAPGDTVVTYCAIGYRASATYFVARYLGYPAKFFDGSYNQWSLLGYPTDTARVSLRRP